ncbi:DNA primase [uncultured Sulfitobacter sp.]|uniref:DNA primase n=1 Tax=uncultured Sulfitobacter sp. TaxID=191468 RepID=UPI00260D34CC|nr:DNA primase [uncultured Sulfitobacter sp.]
MSLPPGFLDELRTRSSLSQVVGRKVMWDARKSNQGKGDMWAPCPFHQEKSASFHVDDRKGFYYCFGCHAKGDAISFVRETENVSFMEAVEILAGEAGMPMPERDPRAAEKADARKDLADVMELAVKWFRLQLRTGAASSAREYLDRRGLSGEVCDRWEIGFAPDSWQGLWDALKGKDIPDDLIIGAGLAKPSTKGGKPYDTFRGRIMYPIRDARGRAIAFGGRAMDPEDKAKYLNSPETELFDKGRSLYNVKDARVAAGKGLPLLVAEGYMDVIALSEAGFGASVAPLGTAITENQLAMLWRISDEPIITLDGDTAGQRAALRLIDLALPLLEAGRSLRFAMMPEGQDPDDLLKASGAGAVQTLIDAAVPMVQLLWNREVEGKNFDSPERKAALDKSLREKIMLIKDPSIRSHYGQAIKDMRWQLFRSKPSGGGMRVAPRGGGKQWGQSWGTKAPQGPSAGAKSSLLAASGNDGTTEHLCEAVILAAFVTCPEIIEDFESGLEGMVCLDQTHRIFRDLMLRHVGQGSDVLNDKIRMALGPDALEDLLSQSHVRLTPSVRNPGNAEVARIAVSTGLAQLEAARGLKDEVQDAADDLSGEADEGLTWRLAEAAKAADMALRAGQEDKAEYVIADNGARLDREQVANSRSMFDKIDFSKGGKKR